MRSKKEEGPIWAHPLPESGPLASTATWSKSEQAKTPWPRPLVWESREGRPRGAVRYGSAGDSGEQRSEASYWHSRSADLRPLTSWSVLTWKVKSDPRANSSQLSCVVKTWSVRDERNTWDTSNNKQKDNNYTVLKIQRWTEEGYKCILKKNKGQQAKEKSRNRERERERQNTHHNVKTKDSQLWYVHSLGTL